MKGSPLHLLAAGFLSAVLSSTTLAVTPEWMEQARPDLFELTLRSKLVIHGKVEVGRVKKPKVFVIEVLRGDFSGDLVHIVFREINQTRMSEEKSIQFLEGQEMILFLRPAAESERPGRFELVRRQAGKIDLPEEGVDAYLGAIRIFALIADSPGNEHFSRILALLDHENPLVSGIALHQIRKHRLATQEQISSLLKILRERDLGNRVLAAQILEQFLGKTKKGNSRFDREEDVMNYLISAARVDESDEVRVAAVGALRAWGSDQAIDAMEIIAKTDPSQAVRYEAELSLLRLKKPAGDASPP